MGKDIKAPTLLITLSAHTVYHNCFKYLFIIYFAGGPSTGRAVVHAGTHGHWRSAEIGEEQEGEGTVEITVD